MVQQKEQAISDNEQKYSQKDSQKNSPVNLGHVIWMRLLARGF